MNTAPLPPELAWIRKLEPHERRFCELAVLERAVYAGQPVFRVGRRAQKVRGWREVLERLVERGAVKIHRDAPGFDPLVSFVAAPGPAAHGDPIAAIRAKLDAQPYYTPLAKLDFNILARYVDDVRAALKKK